MSGKLNVKMQQKNIFKDARVFILFICSKSFMKNSPFSPVNTSLNIPSFLQKLRFMFLSTCSYEKRV